MFSRGTLCSVEFMWQTIWTTRRQHTPFRSELNGEMNAEIDESWLVIAANGAFLMIFAGMSIPGQSGVEAGT